MKLAMNYSTFRRVLKAVVLSSFALVIVISAWATNALFREKRDFKGTLQFQVCAKGPNGTWDVIDEAKINTNFSNNFFQAGRNERLSTDFTWSVRSAKGFDVSFRLVGNAEPRFDPTTGQFELRNAIYEVTLLGVKQNTPFNLTTETINAPNGTFSGKRAQINGNTGSLSLVAVSKFRPHPLLLKKLAEDKQLAARLGVANKPLDELVVVSRVEGTVTAVK